MFIALMASFAFAIAVGALGATALLTSRVAALTNAWASIQRELKQSSTATISASIQAEVDDLRGALDVIRASNRRELGSLWGRLGGKPASRTFEMRDLDPAANDDSFETRMYKPVDAWAMWRPSSGSASGGRKRRKASGSSSSSAASKGTKTRRRSKSSSSRSTSPKRKAATSARKPKFGSDAWHKKYKTGKYKK